MNPPESETPPTPGQSIAPTPGAAAQPPEEHTHEHEAPHETPAAAHVVGPEPKKSGKRKFFTALLLLIILGGLAYGAWMVLQPADKKAAVVVTNSKQDVALINVGVVGGEGDFAIYPADQSNSNTQGFNNQMFEGLVQFKNQSKVVPLLATSWTNPSSTTWDFTIAQNVKFHDGHTMTADDVAYSLNLAAKDPNLSQTYASTILSAKVLGTNKVEVTTNDPDPFLLNRLTYLYVLDSKAPGVMDGSNGTGPYVLKPGTKLTSTDAQMVAFDNYHGGHIYTKALSFKIEADESAAAADLKNNVVNFTGEFASTAPTAPKGVVWHSTVSDSQTISFMSLNSVSPGPLQKLAVRQALRDSIDVNALVKDNNINAVPVSQLVSQVIPGYDPSIAIPSRDVTKAKALLASAGYPNGVSLTVYVSGDDAADALDAIVKQAADAGITITVKHQDDFNQFLSDMADGKYEMAFLAYGSDILDASDVFATTVQGTANYKNATLDSYLDEATAATDPAKRLQILQKTSKLLSDDVAVIPLFDRHRTWLSNQPYVINFENSGSPGVYFWQVYTVK